MKPLLLTYECLSCGNIHSEIIFSSDDVFEVKKLFCNKCEAGRNSEMYLHKEEVETPIGGQVR